MTFFAVVFSAAASAVRFTEGFLVLAVVFTSSFGCAEILEERRGAEDSVVDMVQLEITAGA